jgi:hypothetical protein
MLHSMAWTEASKNENAARRRVLDGKACLAHSLETALEHLGVLERQDAASPLH